MSDEKKREAVEKAIKLTRRAKELGEITAKTSRQLAEAIEDRDLTEVFKRLKEGKKRRKAQNRPVATMPLPDAKACMEAANRARKKAEQQQHLADKAAERANTFEGLAKAAWNLASKEAEEAAAIWINAADAWKEAATQLS